MTASAQVTAPPGAVGSRSAPSTATWLAWAALCAFTIVNANSVAVLAGAPSRLFNPLLLLSALFVIGTTRRELRHLARAPVPAIVVFVVAFLLIGLFSATTANAVSVEQAISRVPLYLASIVLVLAAAQMAHAADRAGQTDLLLKTLFFPAVLASLSGVLFVGVPAFGNYLDLLPGERLHGVFGNVNELGAQAGYSLVIGLALTMRTRRAGWFIVGALAGAIGVTSSFSKSAMLGFLPLVALGPYAAAGARVRLRPLLVLIAGGLALVAGLYLLSDLLLDGRLGIELTNDQRLRLSAIMEIISSGSLDESATTGRASIWAVAIDQWMTAPVLGLGLAAFDRVRGVDMEVHSTVLRILGESGIVGMVTFLVMVAALMLAIMRSPRKDVHVFGLGFAVVQLPAVVSLGYILVSRNHNVLTGCVLGLLVSAARTGEAQAAPDAARAVPDAGAASAGATA